ncbi:hypothetical protein A3B87_02845 [Candidatus Kuenenbacteria bacterium RIFCSPHIGHO2_02_FULL_39_13]|uniref:Radical SAM core domain-containing protein n=1 Tax=Candidatus Kuenenbacteria bacterium RIFCSPHIGHO2_02_FULL_39_13 TaxID=1798561 RepID=A0A1F6FNT6_9BACT|nr:MAG: hypothetical protein A3B87_02845 [Candidatus Kuenenbacteria bacterium RIFCSPHIGHO2_02_FULL_39_13]
MALNCSFCYQRLSHYKENSFLHNLSFKKWLEVIDEATSLGVKVVNISGGEPTLYKELVHLIAACKERSLRVHLKTNGFLVNNKLIKDLVAVGLDSCTISIYSQNPIIHDQTKGIKGSHNSAIVAIKHLKNAGIRTNIQTILDSHIMSSFDEYLKWAASLKVDYLFLSFLEGDSKVKRPSSEEISDFVLNMIPKCKDILTEIFKGKQHILKENFTNLEGLYNFKGISYQEMSHGIYNKGLKGCGRNSTMALILANGEIHPCNAVEYFHKPIVGHLTKESLTHAWQSAKWQEIRKSGIEWCHYCPMNRHTFIKFTEDNFQPSFYSAPD